MTKFETLTVKEVKKETADCVSVAFDVPASAKEKFSFTQGQYITLKQDINGEEVRRSYSICSSPLDNELRVAIKKVNGGLFSTWAYASLQKGMTVEAMPPLGKFFTPLNPAAKNQYVAFASGRCEKWIFTHPCFGILSKDCGINRPYATTNTIS